jgi:hypothetical protein
MPWEGEWMPRPASQETCLVHERPRAGCPAASVGCAMMPPRLPNASHELLRGEVMSILFPAYPRE